MPVEEIIKELDEQSRLIESAQKKQKELMNQLISANDKDWDLMSVPKASQKSGLSISTIYRLINSGKLKCVHKMSVKYISSKELESLDCANGEQDE